METASNPNRARLVALSVLSVVVAVSACSKGETTSPTTVRTAPIVKTADELKKGLPPALQASFKTFDSTAPGKLVWASVAVKGVTDHDLPVEVDLDAWESVAAAEAANTRVRDLTSVPGTVDRCANVSISFTAAAADTAHVADAAIADIKDSLAKAGFAC